MRWYVILNILQTKSDNNASSIPRWTEFYQDSSGQGKMTTVALPVFSSLSGRRLFVGVVGIDVLAKDFGGSLTIVPWQ